ncbi:Early nodulin-93 [Capsicum annuum]|nr:Early nodulin-93 [Capsicum annuum]KAF3681411.1 Early nodulin-93 [Capsicum annuum]
MTLIWSAKTEDRVRNSIDRGEEGVIAGAKAAVIASIATAIPAYAYGKMSPWARTYLNPTAKALIVSTAAGMAYFVVADKTLLKIARQNSFKQT